MSQACGTGGGNGAEVAMRPFGEGDFEAFASLIATMWHDGPDGDLARWQGSEELSHHLSHATWGVVAERGGMPLGLCLVGEVRPAADPAPESGDAACGAPVDAPAWDDRHGGLLDAAAGLSDAAVPDPLCAEEALLMGETLAGDGAGVGVLQLLVVSPESRGLGLGRRLMAAGLDRMRAAGATRYRLSTDEACDWRFYEHLGLRRVAERGSDAVGGPDGPFRHFVYEGDL